AHRAKAASLIRASADGLSAVFVSRARDVGLMVCEEQNMSQCGANLSRQPCRGRVFEDISNSVDCEVRRRSPVMLRPRLAGLEPCLFLWLEVGEMTEKPFIAAEHC